MKITLSVLKADIGSIGGHIRPSERLVEEVKNYVATKGKGLVTDAKARRIELERYQQGSRGRWPPPEGGAEQQAATSEK